MPKFEMRKIIERKLYDTKTAEEIETFNNGLSYNDFNYYSEALYRKKNGEFFLAGEGHAMTKYAKHCADRTSTFGRKIIPLSDDDAKSWLEEHADVETYLKYFSAEE